MRRLFETILLGVSIVVCAAVSRAGSEVPLDRVLGPWLTEKEGAVIEIYQCRETKDLCGRIAWLREPFHENGELKRDPDNPDESLRGRPLCGIEVFTELARIDGDTWAHGHVYNPKDGNRYRAYLNANADGTLHIRGYIGIPLIGKSETWQRPEGIDIGCPAG